MKVFHHHGRRGKYVAAGVLAVSMLASLLGSAPAAHAQPYTIEVEGCDAEDFIEAVEIANAVDETDRIVLDDKCKYEFEQAYFNEDLGLFMGEALPWVTDDLVIYGNKSRAVSDGDDNGAGFRFMTILQADAVEIRDLTISGFELSVPPADTALLPAAGAILNAGADLTLRNSTVKDNEVNVFGGLTDGAAGFAGGIYSRGGSTTLRNSTVSGNEINAVAPLDAAFVIGGGVVAEGGPLDMASSTVKGNKASAIGGVGALAQAGGILVAGDELTMDRSTVSGNSASAKSGGGGTTAAALGGGMVLGPSPFTHEIARSTVSGNRASAKGGAFATAVGGGIVNSNPTNGGVAGLLVDEQDAPAFADIQNVGGSDKSSVLNNTASCDGACAALAGGYAGEGDGSADFNRTLFKGNLADGDEGMALGGGLAVNGDAGAVVLWLDDATVTKNTAKADGFARGGGIAAADAAGVDIDESDIFKNKPDNCWAETVGDFCDFS